MLFSIRLQLGIKLLFLALYIMPNDWGRALLLTRILECLDEMRQESLRRLTELRQLPEL